MNIGTILKITGRTALNVAQGGAQGGLLGAVMAGVNSAAELVHGDGETKKAAAMARVQASHPNADQSKVSAAMDMMVAAMNLLEAAEPKAK